MTTSLMGPFFYGPLVIDLALLHCTLHFKEHKRTCSVVMSPTFHDTWCPCGVTKTDEVSELDLAPDAPAVLLTGVELTTAPADPLKVEVADVTRRISFSEAVF